MPWGIPQPRPAPSKPPSEFNERESNVFKRIRKFFELPAPGDPILTEGRLRSRTNAEIVARLLYRVENLSKSNRNYLQMLYPLDRIAAERITDLEQQIASMQNKSVGDFPKEVDRILTILRDPGLQ